MYIPVVVVCGWISASLSLLWAGDSCTVLLACIPASVEVIVLYAACNTESIAMFNHHYTQQVWPMRHILPHKQLHESSGCHTMSLTQSFCVLHEHSLKYNNGSTVCFEKLNFRHYRRLEAY